MQSELQRINGAKNWAIGFMLHPFSSWHLEKLGGTSQRTYAINNARNQLTKELKASIEADYQRFKANELSKRKADL